VLFTIDRDADVVWYQSWQMRLPAPQSKLLELHPKGSLRMLYAGNGHKKARFSGLY
jgi:hypothetical protein